MDPFIYRECRATITARIPDTPDADAHPDRVLVQGRGTAHPKFQGGSVVFTEIGEYAIPQPIPVVIVDGELLVEVLSGDESVETQPLYLPVTVDERANQNWSWRLTFDFLTLGEYGEEVKHPPLSFPVEAGDGPLELAKVATPQVKSTGFVTRGLRGYSVSGVTAADGQLVFEWEDGGTDAVPLPDAVQGVGVESVTQDSPDSMALVLTDGSITGTVTLPPGPPGQDGANVLPTDTAIAQAVSDEGSETATALATAMSAAIEHAAKYEGPTLPAQLFGVVSSNNIDQSAVLQVAMDTAAALKKTLYLPPGRIRATNLKVPKNLSIVGGGYHAYYRRTYNDQESDRQTWVQQITGAPTPLFTIGSYDDPEGPHGGSGVTLSNLMIAGTSGAQAPLVHQKQGFEVLLDNVLLYGNIGAPGLVIDAASNCKYNVQIQLCGSDTLPALLFASTEHPWANTAEGWAPLANSNDFDNLRVERSKNQAMWIGVGADALSSFAEFTRMTNPHFEAPASEPNVRPMIEVGSIRSLDIVNPFFYGGGDCLLFHNQLPYGDTPGQSYRGDADLGGITVLGGVFLGRTAGNSPTQSLVVLRGGNGFHAVGTKFWRQTNQAVRIDSTYGPDVVVDSKQSQYGWDSTTIQPGGHTRPGRIRLIRDNRTGYRASASVEPPAGTGATVTVTGDDYYGTVTLTAGTSPGVGAMVQVLFPRTFNEIRTVVLTPTSQESASKGLYVSNTWVTGFQVGLAISPTAGQVVRFNYAVLRP